MTIAFFAVCGLDVLQSLETTLPPAQRQHIVDWVYAHQVVPGPTTAAIGCGGFQGSSTLNVANAPDGRNGTNDYKWGHVAMTYTAIGILVTLGDDLSRLDRRAIIEGTWLNVLPISLNNDRPIRFACSHIRRCRRAEAGRQFQRVH